MYRIARRCLRYHHNCRSGGGEVYHLRNLSLPQEREKDRCPTVDWGLGGVGAENPWRLTGGKVEWECDIERNLRVVSRSRRMLDGPQDVRRDQPNMPKICIQELREWMGLPHRVRERRVQAWHRRFTSLWGEARSKFCKRRSLCRGQRRELLCGASVSLLGRRRHCRGKVVRDAKVAITLMPAGQV